MKLKLTYSIEKNKKKHAAATSSIISVRCGSPSSFINGKSFVHAYVRAWSSGKTRLRMRLRRRSDGLACPTLSFIGSWLWYFGYDIIYCFFYLLICFKKQRMYVRIQQFKLCNSTVLGVGTLGFLVILLFLETVYDTVSPQKKKCT